MLYLAYGSNLNLEQMAWRCPKAEPLYGLQLNGFRLIFRGVADITQDEDAQINLGVFKITDECEVALDRYEGFPELYDKMYITMDGEEFMTYQMVGHRIYPPSEGYYRSIEQGYRDFGFDTELLRKAKSHSQLRRYAA